MTRPLALLLTLVLALALAACGEDNSVGGGEVFEFDQQQAEALGGSTTTTAAPENTVPDQSTTTVAADQTTTTVQQTTTTLPPEEQQVSVEVLIQEDATGQAFAPRIVAIPVGGKVRFVNTTSVARSVVADNGAFDSGNIAPGGVWIFEATSPGQYNYTDGTRPYAVGTVDVQ